MLLFIYSQIFVVSIISLIFFCYYIISVVNVYKVIILKNSYNKVLSKVISQKKFYCVNNSEELEVEFDFLNIVHNSAIYCYVGFLNDFVVIDENTKYVNGRNVFDYKFNLKYGKEMKLFIKLKKIQLIRDMDRKDGESLAFEPISDINEFISKNIKFEEIDLSQFSLNKKKPFIIGRSSCAGLYYYSELEEVSELFFSFDIVNKINLKKNKINVYIFEDVIIVVFSQIEDSGRSILESEFILKNDGIKRVELEWKFHIISLFTKNKGYDILLNI